MQIYSNISTFDFKAPNNFLEPVFQNFLYHLWQSLEQVFYKCYFYFIYVL